MINLLIASTIAVVVLGLLWLFYIYQNKRLYKIFEIRDKWRKENDNRFSFHRSEYMFFPNINNWFGLRWPNEKYYNHDNTKYE